MVNAHLRAAAIPTFRHRFRAISRHFALSESKMAAKTTSGSGFDMKFRLVAPVFLLECGFGAVTIFGFVLNNISHAGHARCRH